jgi:hypothetical protein
MWKAMWARPTLPLESPPLVLEQADVVVLRAEGHERLALLLVEVDDLHADHVAVERDLLGHVANPEHHVPHAVDACMIPSRRRVTLPNPSIRSVV